MDGGAGTFVVEAWKISLALEWLNGFLACMLRGGPYTSSMKWTAGSAHLVSRRGVILTDDFAQRLLSLYAR